MPDQSRGVRAATFHKFVSQEARHRIYAVLAAHAAAGVGVETGLAALADAYGGAEIDRDLGGVASSALALVRSGSGLGAALARCLGKGLPEEAALVRSLDAPGIAPSAQGVLLSAASALLAAPERRPAAAAVAAP